MGTTEATMNTQRTIEQILAIRLQAAQMRVTARAQALTADPSERNQNAKRLADEALELAQREADAQKGLPVERVKYAPDTTFALKRYAALLVAANPMLNFDAALEQAYRDDNARFEDWYKRYADNSDLDGLPDDQI
jgi:hypothetical protein